jgi:acyl-CoA synthetase (AMP-forming)/AMP-acid ligase II
MPVFGLAECSVGLAVPPVQRGPRFDRVDRAAFETGHATPAAADDPHANIFVSAGRALPEHEIKVVGPSGETLPERVVGSLLFRGPSMTAGYYRNEEATAAILRPGGFLDSGDLAYFADGELYIAGRLKDLIIRGGRNLVAAEIEEAASEAEGVRKGCVAAFGVTDPQGGTEQVVIVAETKATLKAEREAIETALWRPGRSSRPRQARSVATTPRRCTFPATSAESAGIPSSRGSNSRASWLEARPGPSRHGSAWGFAEPCSTAPSRSTLPSPGSRSPS